MGSLRFMLPLLCAGLLAACTTPFKAQVSRFQQLPAPTGQSFVIEPVDDSRKGSLEFASYASLVAQRLAGLGYQPAVPGAQPTLVVRLDYGVNDGRERIATRPGSYYGGYGWGYYGYPYYRRPYYGGYGWYDPFWGGYGGFGAPEVYSYTVYRSFLDMRITRSDGQPVFEGRAVADTRSGDLPALVPNLVSAMFTNFPGNSGETVTIKLEPPKG